MTVTIFCDGAVKGNGGPGVIGMGAVLLQDVSPYDSDKVISKSRFVSWRMKLPRATNIRAELEAIYRSLLLIKDEKIAQVSVQVFTDSEWAVRTFGGQYRSTAHAALRQRITDRFHQFKSWELGYEKGHAGHQWQEAADELASRAAGTWKLAGTRLPKDYEIHDLEAE